MPSLRICNATYVSKMHALSTSIAAYVSSKLLVDGQTVPSRNTCSNSCDSPKFHLSSEIQFSISSFARKPKHYWQGETPHKATCWWRGLLSTVQSYANPGRTKFKPQHLYTLIPILDLARFKQTFAQINPVWRASSSIRCDKPERSMFVGSM